MNVVFLIFQVVSFDKCELKIHVFKLFEEGPANEEIEDDDISAASHWVLPAGEKYFFDSDHLSYTEQVPGGCPKKFYNFMNHQRLIIKPLVEFCLYTCFCKELNQHKKARYALPVKIC